MQRTTTNRAGRAHQGSGSHHDRHDGDAMVGYELAGAVRWLDQGLRRIVLHVKHGGAHGGAFVGQDITVDLADAALHGAALEDLIPGTSLRVKLRLPRALATPLPELLHARSAYLAG